MLRARLWYGPVGHELGLDSVSRYLRGPLACEVRAAQTRHQDGWVEQLEINAPVSATIEITSHHMITLEAALMAQRLPPAAPGALRKRLAACTARLEVSDMLGAPPLLPTTVLARSVLMPLAFAMGGYVEEMDTGRLLYHPRPGDARRANALRKTLDALIGAFRR